MKTLWTTFRYTYASHRWQVIGWGLGLALYGLMIVSMYESLGAQQGRLQEMIASYPPEFLAFFGGNANSLLTPAGFLGMYAFSMMPLIIGIFAALAGSGLIASDEEHGRLDLIISHPVGRPSFFLGRALGLLGAIVSILVLGWLGFSFMLGRSSLGFTWGQMGTPFLSLFVQTLIIAALALLLSLLVPSRNLAAMLSGAFVVISYSISSLSFLDERLAMMAKFFPYHYYQTVLSFQQLNPAWLLALLGISFAMILLAYLRFFRRDIRLSGEGNWRDTLINKNTPHNTQYRA